VGRVLNRYVVLPLVVALLGAVGACTSDAPGPEPAAEVTPIEEFDAVALALATGPFCDRIDPGAVEAAVGAGAAEAHWSSGDTVRVAPTVRDVVHEDGCQWTGRSGDGAGDTARAWVFVPPVTVKQARTLVREAERSPGCTAVSGHRFGKPATGTVCGPRDAREASYRGLFGDVWLTCAVRDGGKQRLDRAELLQRAGDWCVAAAQAAEDESTTEE
jgi:hypothetical protein